MKSLDIKLIGDGERFADFLRMLAVEIEVRRLEKGRGTWDEKSVFYEFELKNMINNYDTKILRDAMYELGLSTYQLAAAAGLPQSIVAGILLDERRATGYALERLCKALDLEPGDVRKTQDEIKAAA